MDTSGFNELAEFLFDQSTTESDDGTQGNKSPDALRPQNRGCPNRGRRTRARRACVTCNKRKVRCDVLSLGHTCTNCRLDGITCAVRSRGKQRRGTLPGPLEDIPAVSGTEVQPSKLVSSPLDEPVELATVTPSPLNSLLYNFASPFSMPTGPPQTCIDTDVMYAYFEFLETGQWTHLAPEDFKFLEYKGCFHLPSRPILDDLVREYFLHVHPLLPIINEGEFWEMYDPRFPQIMRNKITLFVFRAMLFASCSFASDATIRHLGFQSAVEARSCMYRRAKLLYDFNTVSDPIAVSQGALILTYYSSDQEPLANTSWLRLAIQYANSVNVEMYDRDLLLSTEERLVRKRLWWCLVLRDRILPLGVRRPIHITHSTFDFSQPKLSANDLEPEFGKSRVYDEETKRDLATVFLAQIDLAIELTDPISYIYPANGFQSFDKLDYGDRLLMRPSIKRCRERLDIWHSGFEQSVGAATWPTKHKSVALCAGLTSIYYQSARAALCQYESFNLQNDDFTEQGVRMEELGGVLHSSMANISDTVRELLQLGVAKYIPVSMVAYLALPIILNSLDLQTLTPKNARTKSKLRRLRLLNEALQICRQRYTGTIAASTLIEKTIETARSDYDAEHVQYNKSTSLLTSHSDINNWFDLFVRKPTQYLRISFAIDISFCTGRYPDTQDYLPQRLMSHCQTTLPPLTPQALISESRNLRNSPDRPDELLATNSQLDFLDLDDLYVYRTAEGAPWTGRTVDEMLDKVLEEGGF